jgi:hypothetical protein
MEARRSGPEGDARTWPHPLEEMFVQAARGCCPIVDGAAQVVPPPGDGLESSVAFTGHAVISTALPAREVITHAVDGYGGSTHQRFLSWLAGPTGWIDTIDCTMVAVGRGGGDPLPKRFDADDEPRVARARSPRAGVRVFGDARGFVTLGRGPAGRRELAVEIPDRDQGTGVGRGLLAGALGLVPRGEPVFAAVAPGNTRSLRAFLACGLHGAGHSEVLLRPERPAG